MRIAVVGHGLRGGGGISVGRNLIAALGRVAPEHHYLVITPDGLGYDAALGGAPSMRQVAVPHRGVAGRLAFDWLSLPRLVRAFSPDVILWLGNMLDPTIPVPHALLCHNPHRFYRSREWVPKGVRLGGRYHAQALLRRLRFARDLKHASLLLPQTRTAERRIRAMYGYTGPVVRCPNAVSEIVRDASAAGMPASLRPYASKRKLFCLTRYYRHKNLETLVDLFDHYVRELADTVLVITVAADQHAGARRLLQQIRVRGLEDRIVNVGPLPQDALPGYYRASDAFILPTLLESFSGTYLEAMHFGLPILTSDRDFAREICGDAALYFEPMDLASILGTIDRLGNTPDLVARGRQRLAHVGMTWDEIVLPVLDGLAAIAGR